MSAAPDPFCGVEIDLQDFSWMPLDVVRLRDSDLAAIATAEEFRAGVLLWCAAWHQVPAGSVPDDERVLARLSGFGRDVEAWRAVAVGATRGFVKCSDGRLYHQVVCEKALQVFAKRQNQSKRTANATKARLAKSAASKSKQPNVQRDDDATRDSTEAVTSTNRREEKDPIQEGTSLGEGVVALPTRMPAREGGAR
jgi:hypothetical protein